MSDAKNLPNARIGVQLSAVMALLGERMYSTDTVFIRENVQNAIDAMRLLCKRENMPIEKFTIQVRVKPDFVEIEDWGIGMAYQDIISYYWNVGSSSKNTPEAREAGCIGQFGIGGFANFGICSEVHIYTAHYESSESERYSFVRKSDLQQNKDDLVIIPSQQLKHHGTMIRCVPQKKFDVGSILTYLKRYVQHLPERVVVNGELISQMPFQLEEEKSYKEYFKAVRFKYGYIKGSIIEYPDSRVNFKLDEVVVNGISYRCSGKVELSHNSLRIYKHRFLISDYVYSSKYLSGKVDLPFVKPIASREGFDSETQGILLAFHSAITQLLITFISDRRDLLNAYRGTPLTEAVYVSEDVKLLKNLSVTLLDATVVTLEELERKSKELNRDGLAIYYLKGDITTTARALQNRGNMVVTISELDRKTKWIAERFLIFYCGSLEVPDTLPEELPIESLDGNTRFVLGVIQKSLERQRCFDIKVQPCRFITKLDIPLLLKENETKLLVNIKHSDFINISEYTNSKIFDVVVDCFLKDYLEDSLVRIRKKIFGHKGKGISILAPDEKYRLIIEAVEEVRLVKLGGHPWLGEEANLVQITSDDFPDLSGYYLNLPPLLSESYRQYLAEEHKIEVIAYFKKLIYLIYYEAENSLIIEIDLDKSLYISKDENEGVRSFMSRLKKHILIRSKGIYLPIIPELEISFIPKGVPRVMFIGAKLEREDGLD